MLHWRRIRPTRSPVRRPVNWVLLPAAGVVLDRNHGRPRFCQLCSGIGLVGPLLVGFWPERPLPSLSSEIAAHGGEEIELASSPQPKLDSFLSLSFLNPGSNREKHNGVTLVMRPRRDACDRRKELLVPTECNFASRPEQRPIRDKSRVAFTPT